jgi:hypothetical protein
MGANTPTQLGRLDADVSSRAPASTALSTSIWTAGRAAFLNASVLSRSSQTSVDTIDSNVDTLLARIPSAVPIQRTSNACNVVAVCDGTDHLEIDLGTTFSVLRSLVQVSGPYQNASPANEPQFANTRWAWINGSTLYVRFFDSSGSGDTFSSAFSVRVVVLEYA